MCVISNRMRISFVTFSDSCFHLKQLRPFLLKCNYIVRRFFELLHCAQIVELGALNRHGLSGCVCKHALRMRAFFISFKHFKYIHSNLQKRINAYECLLFFIFQLLKYIVQLSLKNKCVFCAQLLILCIILCYWPFFWQNPI